MILEQTLDKLDELKAALNLPRYPVVLSTKGPDNIVVQYCNGVVIAEGPLDKLAVEINAWCAAHEKTPEQKQAEQDAADIASINKHRDNGFFSVGDKFRVTEDSLAFTRAVFRLADRVEKQQKEIHVLLACPRGEQNCRECPDLDCCDNMRKRGPVQ